MDPELILRWLHVIGACVLLGTGAGIAFFMMMAHRGGDVRLIAGTARIVVVADMVFTATAAVAQPLTGWLLARETGWDLTEGWILASLALYVLTGACWLPVVRVQITLRATSPPRRRGPAPRSRPATTGSTGSGSPSASPPSQRCWRSCG